MTVWPDPRSRLRALESRKFGHFQRLSSPPFTMGASKLQRIFKLGHNIYSLSGPDFLFLSQFLCHATLKLSAGRSQPPVLYRANLFILILPVGVKLHIFSELQSVHYMITELNVICVCILVCILLTWGICREQHVYTWIMYYLVCSVVTYCHSTYAHTQFFLVFPEFLFILELFEVRPGFPEENICG